MSGSYGNKGRSDGNPWNKEEDNKGFEELGVSEWEGLSGVGKAKKVVGTALGLFGRFGDDRISKVDNKPAHVNAFESYLIDNYGKLGEELVKETGAGTINPKTGLKEYHGSAMNPFNTPMGHPLHHTEIGQQFQNIYEGIDQYAFGGTLPGGSDPFWENIPGYDDLEENVTDWWNEFTGHSEDVRLEEEATDVVKSGLEGLTKEGEQYLGQGGIIGKKYGLERDRLSHTTRGGLGEVSGWESTAISKTGFSGHGGIRSIAAGKRESTINDYRLGQKIISGQEEKDRLDYLSKLRRDKTTLLTDYMTAIGDVYEGDTTEFDEMMGSYGG